MSVRIIKADEPLTDPDVLSLRDRLREGALTAVGAGKVSVSTVADIIENVSERGDDAVIVYTKDYDTLALAPDRLRVSQEDIDKAHSEASGDFLELTRRAAANIREYQESIRTRAPDPLVRDGRELSVRYTPIGRVGVYVPGGRAIYPSTVLMTVVPAQVAGVREIAMVSPPTCEGDINPTVLALAGELGVGEVYRVGGAQAIAALAFGTETIGAVDKIVGPGNAFVTEAKRQVMGRVGIDSIAGPSEVLIVADETAKPEWLAADMWAQAEHNPGSAVLVTPSEALAEAVKAAVENVPDDLARAGAIRECLDAYGAIIVVPDLASACAVANDFAAEHLQIVTVDDQAALARISSAGAAFLGPHSPVPLGDYYAGPSHVLPTGGTARFFGPLSCNDFLKATSVVRYDAAALREDADDVINFATREGLTAHARAIEVRRKPD